MPLEPKRHNNDPDSRDVRHRPKRRRRETPEASNVHVNCAQASGDSRMLTGTVNGHVIHGNYIASANVPSVDRESTYSTAQQTAPQNASDVLSIEEKQNLISLLRFDQLDARLTTVKREQPKTCVWLLKRKDYRRWINSDILDGADGFFWIRGNPGTGKSIAMKFLCQKLESKFRKQPNKIVVSFFFNARGASLEKSTLGLYRSLLYTLFSRDSSLDKAFDKCYKRTTWLRILHQSMWEPPDEQLLKELFERVVHSLTKKKKRLYCFVDALDECPMREVSSMITYFENLSSRVDSGNFRICFSSRHYPQISIRTQLTITLEKEDCHYNDIVTYVESQLHIGNEVDEEELSNIRAKILEKSCGIFLWVNLVVYRLNQVYHQDGRIGAIHQALEAIPKAEKETPTENGERALYGLFRDMMQKDDENIDRLVRFCQLIYCATQPLSPQELHVALCGKYEESFNSSQFTDEYLRKQVLRYSKGFAEVTVTKQPTVQFIHETVREFLRDGGLNTLVGTVAHHSIDSAGHELFKEICLQQILAPVEKELKLISQYRERARHPKLGTVNFRSSAVKVRRQQKEYLWDQAREQFPFLQYAVRNILFHANESKSLGNTQETFLQCFPLESWIPLINLFSKYRKYEFNGAKTSVLYVLAWHGYAHLIRESSVPRAEYGKTERMEEFSTPLACAIYNGHLGAIEALVGQEPGWLGSVHSIPQRTQASRREALQREILLVTLAKFKNPQLLIRVLQDGVCDADELQILSWRHVYIRCLHQSSERILDILVKHGKVKEFCLPQLGPGLTADQAPSDENPLPYIDGALSVDPTLLTKLFFHGSIILQDICRANLLLVRDLFLKHSGAIKDALNIYLHAAARANRPEMVKDALNRGADLSFEYEQGRSLLHVAAQFPVCLEVIMYLLDMHPSIMSVTDTAGLTPLQRFGHMFSHKVKMVFLGAGSDPNTSVLCRSSGCCDDHQVPLATVCALNNDESTLKALVSDGRCELNAPDVHGRTPLSYCFGSHWIRTEACRVLMTDKDINFNARDKNGYTILEHLIKSEGFYWNSYHYKEYKEQEMFLNTFCEASGLDPNLEASDGQAPLELIISLYDTWPHELKDEIFRRLDSSQRSERQRIVSEHLLKVAESLLRSGRVDRLVQQRCLALDKTPLDIREAIEKSLDRFGILD